MTSIWNVVLASMGAGVVALGCAAQGDADASSPPENAQSETALELSPISAFVGHWTGTGEYTMGPGNVETVDIKEKATWRFDGKAILVEGKGTIKQEDGTEKTVHDAIGMIFVDEQTGKVMMHAFKPDGPPVVSEISEQEDGGLQWGFDTGPNQKVRFTIRFTQTTWHEAGEFSPNGGETWYPFMEMTLHKDDAKVSPDGDASEGG